MQVYIDKVAEAVRQAHFETSHIQYNDENALSYTISLALYAARNFYTVHREFPGGKGFADLVFLPRKKFIDKPALVVELKWDRTAEGAINQIKRNEYCRSLKDYQGNLLLVGINYDRKTKEHECVIEEINNDLEGHSAGGTGSCERKSHRFAERNDVFVHFSSLKVLT